MKLVIAMIQPHQLPAVKTALFEQQIYQVMVTNALSTSEDQKGYQETFRGVGHEVTLLKRIRLEIPLNNDRVEDAIGAILKGTRSGFDDSEGVVLVVDLPEFIRIRTGERGAKAILAW